MSLPFKKVIKRDGRVVPFNQEKITNAIFAAARAAGGKDRKRAEQLSNLVIKELKKKVKKRYPSIEQIQDIVEKILIEEGHARTAKAYISYRQKRAAIRLEKQRVLEKDYVDEVDKAFDLNALRVLKSRYLRKDESGKLIETPKQLFTRVAVHVSLPELLYDKSVFSKAATQKIQKSERFDCKKHAGKFSVGEFKLNQYHLEALKRLYDRLNKQKHLKLSWKAFLSKLKQGKFNKHEKIIQEFFDLMVSKRFLPNTPAIANFGNALGMGSACFVLGIEDSMEGIMETLKKTAMVFKAGGGMGYNFSKLRPEGDFVSTTHGSASGPLSFMRLFDTMTDVVKQGGIRRGANMGILNSNHPDIEKFITAKEGNKALRNFNISVMIMPEFWECLEKNKPYPLLNPRSGKVVRTINAKMLFDLMVHHAWDSAEPGMIYFDHVNEHNPFLEHLGPILSTNPCVSADTLVSTENGLERIDSINAENIAVDARTAINYNSDSSISLQKGVEFVKHEKIIKTGVKDAFKLETNSGYELLATPDHRILTDAGWKQLSDLSNSNNVFIQSGSGKFNTDNKLPFKVENTFTGLNGRKYSFNLPTHWSKELGLILGWLVGDGWLSNKYNHLGLVFSRDDDEVRQVLQPVFEEYCNRKSKLINPKDSCRQIMAYSKFIIDFFSKLGVKSVQDEREVPSSIFTATEEAVCGFLSGLFSADGTIGMGSKSRNYIRLNSSSLKLMKGTQVLLLNLGIRSSIYNRSTKPKKFPYTKTNGETIEYKTSGVNYELNISKENIPTFLEKIEFIQSRHKEKIKKLEKFEFYSENFFDKVKSIEFVGKKEVWDITEPVTHSFIANGFVVHNCGEVVLYPNESCNLGSVNVWSFVHENGKEKMVFDWNAFAKTIKLAAKFLDNIIDVNKFPLKDIEEMTLSTRKTGLGLMGLGDLLYDLNIPYDSEKGHNFMEQIMEFINYHSKLESIELAKTRGKFPYYNKSFFPKGKLPFKGFYEKKSCKCNWRKVVKEIKKHGIRNGFTTVIAPTGSISMIAGCSSGIEPVYSLVFEKHVKVGSFYYVNPIFEKIMSEEGLFDDDLLEDVVRCKGSINSLGYIPPKFKKLFVTAHDISPENHIRALAAFQKWVDSSISKTINFPANATVEEMKKCYILAHKLGCKDVTVYRDTSIKGQVLVTHKKKKEHGKQLIAAYTDEERPTETLEAPVTPRDNGSATLSSPEEVKYCPNDNTALVMKEGCIVCPVCGWGKCNG